MAVLSVYGAWLRSSHARNKYGLQAYALNATERLRVVGRKPTSPKHVKCAGAEGLQIQGTPGRPKGLPGVFHCPRAKASVRLVCPRWILGCAGGAWLMRIAMKPVDKPPPGCSLTIWTVVFEVRRRPDLDGRKPPGGVNTLATGSRDRASEFFGCAPESCGRSVPVFCSDAVKT